MSDTGDSTDDFGFGIAGGVFFNDQWEGFARWDTLILDAARTAPGWKTPTASWPLACISPSCPSLTRRVTLEVGYTMEATTGAEGAINLDRLDAFSGILGDAESGEIMLSAMFQIMF